MKASEVCQMFGLNPKEFFDYCKERPDEDPGKLFARWVADNADVRIFGVHEVTGETIVAEPRIEL